jgi:hypothetical protein
VSRESVLTGNAVDWLNAQPLTYAWRNNTGVARFGDRFVAYGQVGSADIIACIRGRFVAIETKAKRGKQSVDQARWQKKIEAAGGTYWLVRSLDELRGLWSHAP